MPEISQEDLLTRLRWRYAVKQFDATRKISQDDWLTLQTAIQLSPSSFGLQPWQFIVVTNAKIKAELARLSWGQPQPRDCSHMVAMAARESIEDDYIDRFMNKVAADRKIDVAAMNGYRNVISGFVSKMERETMFAWTTRQVYIALGQLMTAAAMVDIDACPMEGIDAAGYDKLLGLEGTGYRTVVGCAVGYRSVADSNAKSAKVRFEADEIFRNID